MEADSSWFHQLWLVGALAAAVPLLTVATALLERSGPIRLRSWLDEIDGSLRLLAVDVSRFEAFRFLVNLLAKSASLALVGTLVGLEAWGGKILGVVVSVVAVVFWVGSSELLARRLLAWDVERALQMWTWILKGLYWVLRPFLLLVAPWTPGLREREEESEPEVEAEVSEEAVEAFLDVGTREGILEPEERELVWGVVDFGDTPVRMVMTPRVDIVGCSVAASLEDLADRFVHSAHTRIPVYRETIDQIVGVVHVRDLLVGLRTVPQPRLEELAHPPLLIPETRLLKDVLRDLRSRRQQLAIVINEWGGTEGLVTVQDLLERIVGEIPDEHGLGPVGAQQLGDGSFLLDGRMELDELGERFDFHPQDLDSSITTLGGWLTQRLGRVPEPGEVVEESGLRFEVDHADGRRVIRVRLRPKK